MTTTHLSKFPLWIVTSRKKKQPVFLAKYKEVVKTSSYSPFRNYTEFVVVTPYVCATCETPLTHVSFRRTSIDLPEGVPNEGRYYGIHALGDQNKQCIALSEMLQHTDMTK